MGVNTRLSADISAFKSGITQAQQSVKTLDAELKRNEAQFKATGDKEKYMQAQTQALNSKMNEQRSIIRNAENALKAMEQNGVKPTDAAYQQMQRTLLNAQTAVANITSQMNTLDSSEQKAASSAEKMVGSLGSINQKVSLDQVISGVNSITRGLEDAARAAINFAREAWGEIMDIAGYADDVATNAIKYGLSTEEYQAMSNIAATWGETSVEAIMNARQRVRANLHGMTDDMKAIFADIGFNPYIGLFGTGPLKDWEDVFWGVGEALLAMEDDYARADYAQKIFGRRWEELMPMFKMGRTEYEKLVEDEKKNVISDENIQNSAKFADTIKELEQKLLALEGTIIGKLAPGLTAAAEGVGRFLDRLLAFLETERGQELLDRMAQAISGLFEDLANLDPETVVEGFVGVFDKIVSGLEWLFDHKQDIVDALKFIVIGWGGLKLFGGALDILKLINGVTTLFGAGTNAAISGAAAKTVTGTTLKSVAGAAMPFIATDAAVLAVASLPAIIAQLENEEEWISAQNRRLDAAGSAGANEAFIRGMAVAIGPKLDGNGNYVRNFLGMLNMNPVSETDALLMGLSSRNNQQRAELFNTIRMYNPYTEGNYTTDLLLRYWAGEELDPVVVTSLAQNITDAMAAEAIGLPTFKVPENAAEEISDQIGEVPVEVVPRFRDRWDGYYGGGGAGAGGGMDTVLQYHANGIPWVPTNGYLAVLHRGERVMPASENRNYTANSNLYIENMHMGGGMDAQALAAAMSAQNRRISAGFGA